MAVVRLFFIFELTQIPNVITLSPTWIGLATNAAPIVCQEKQTKAGKLQKRCATSLTVALQIYHTVDLRNIHVIFIVGCRFMTMRHFFVFLLAKYKEN